MPKITKRPCLAELPELGTRVGLHGSLRHTEVGGSICYGVFVAIAGANQPPLMGDGR